MKLTADTITDEQIRELQQAVPNRGEGREIHRHILDALRTDEGARYRGGRHNARAYCAGVLNARAEGK